MRRYFFATAIAVFSFGFAQAASQMNMPLSAVLQKVHSLGYQSIFEAKLKHGIYKIEALDSHQQAVDILVSAETGQLIPAQELMPKKTMLDIVKPLEKVGNKLYSVDLEHNGFYQIKLFNAQGQRKTIFIDANAARKEKPE